MPVADGEDVPRLSAVVERQRRELARARADGDAAVVVATARGVLMERHGLSLAQAARQLADMAAAAGLPQPEMAAAVLAEEAAEPAGRPAGRRRHRLTDRACAVLDGTALDHAVLTAPRLEPCRGAVRRGAREERLAPGSGSSRRCRDRARHRGGRAGERRRRARRRARRAAADPVRRRRGRGVAARRRRRARAVRRGRARRHRGEPLAAAAAAVRLPGAAGGRHRKRPVVAGRAARGRPRARHRAVGPGRRPRAARPAGPVGDPARRGRSLVAGQARRVRRRAPGRGCPPCSPGSPRCSALRLSYGPVGSTALSPGIWMALDELARVRARGQAAAGRGRRA